MAIKNFTTELKDSGKLTVKVDTSSYPATQGIDIQLRLTKLITPLLKGVDNADLSKLKSFSDLLSLNVNFERLANGIIQSIDNENIKDLLLDILSFTRVGGMEVSKKEIFDIAFSGEYKLLLDAISFVLKSNFDFFGEVE